MKKLGFLVIGAALVLGLSGCWMVGPTGTVEGVVIDATTGYPVEGVSVSAYAVMLAMATTDEYGEFSIILPSGEQTLEFSHPDYDFQDVVVDVTAADTTYVSNSVMASPEFESDGIRFVLTWGASPSDLDSHLITPSGYHIYYGNRTPSGAGAYLDVDDTTSYGPETTTITDQESGTYGYYVHNFSGSPDITTSGAVVSVYDASGFVQSISVPTTGTGRYWNVAKLNGSTLTVVNSVEVNEPSY